MSGPEWLETRLGFVSDGLREDPGAWVTAATVQGLTEALRAAAGQHQPEGGVIDDNGIAMYHCCFDGQTWPCNVVWDVTMILGELL